MTGLAPKTLAIIEAVSSLACIKDFVLVGGTNIALQINHRLSEDLDFCKWVSASNVANGIEIKIIEQELKEKFGNVKVNQLSFDQVDFHTQGVKITFFNEVGYNVPNFERRSLIKNIQSAPLKVVGSMKVKTMFERNTFRDYYDVFVLVKEGIVRVDQLIESSILYNRKLEKQMIINRLQRWDHFEEDSGFAHLSPKYPVSKKGIGEFFLNLLSTI